MKLTAEGLGPGGSDYNFGEKPVTHVAWYDTIRFVNWLHNGQGSGDTETGAYTIEGDTWEPSNGGSIKRNTDAEWFLPSHDEWYKVAYHKNDGITGNYWEYTTSSDSPPNNHLPSADTGNSANVLLVNFTTGNTRYKMTDIGAFTLSSSPYGTFDQGGNVWEWVENANDPFRRGTRGGSWSDYLTHSRVRGQVEARKWKSSIGFRVAAIPAPSTLMLGAMSGLFLIGWRGRLW